MSEVEWKRLSANSYEDMVSVLLSQMNPKLRRIDGSGGDGGRDAEFPRDEGPEIYQLTQAEARVAGNALPLGRCARTWHQRESQTSMRSGRPQRRLSPTRELIVKIELEATEDKTLRMSLVPD
jgi:hypothetical protein